MLEIPTSHMLCRRTNTINNKHGENHHIYNTQCVKPPRITTTTCSTEQYGIVGNNRNVTLLGATGNNGERRSNLVLATVMLRACHRGHLVETELHHEETRHRGAHHHVATSKAVAAPSTHRRNRASPQNIATTRMLRSAASPRT